MTVLALRFSFEAKLARADAAHQPTKECALTAL